MLQCCRTQAQQQLKQLKEELLSQDINLQVITASMKHCRISPGKQRSFDAPSVLFRLQVAEASLERERAKLHEATKEQVQGEAFQNPKRLAKKMF